MQRILNIGATPKIFCSHKSTLAAHKKISDCFSKYNLGGVSANQDLFRTQYGQSCCGAQHRVWHKICASLDQVI